jgi:uncharacterized protein YdcH (DUF465 family)
MMKSASGLREQLMGGLLKNHDEFRRLYETHQTLEQQLAEMNGRLHLNGDEEMERKRIQKLKLRQKDRMEEILREVQQEDGVAFA